MMISTFYTATGTWAAPAGDRSEDCVGDLLDSLFKTKRLKRVGGDQLGEVRIESNGVVISAIGDYNNTLGGQIH